MSVVNSASFGNELIYGLGSRFSRLFFSDGLKSHTIMDGLPAHITVTIIKFTVQDTEGAQFVQFKILLFFKSLNPHRCGDVEGNIQRSGVFPPFGKRTSLKMGQS